MSYAELLERQAKIQERLGVLLSASSSSSSVSVAVAGAAAHDKEKDAAAAEKEMSGGTATATATTTTTKAAATEAKKAAAAIVAPPSSTVDVLPSSIRIVKSPPPPPHDTHRDFVLKELQWLAADFTAERQRHKTTSRKLATAIRFHFSQRETRRVRDLQIAEQKRRKLAARISRQVVTGWWGKLNQVLAYQQKLSAEQARNMEMNAQLVQLVQLTERYTQQLATTTATTTSTAAAATAPTTTISCSGGSLWQQQQQFLTIEQALAAAKAPRRSKQRIKDYARMQQQQQQTVSSKASATTAPSAVLYGESTEDSDSSDDSWQDVYHHHHDDDDDETTLAQAELEEIQERRRLFQTTTTTAGAVANDDNDENDNDIIAIPSTTIPFQADPRELQLLQEEADMDIDQVLERLLRQEGSEESGGGGDEDKNNNSDYDDKKDKKDESTSTSTTRQGERSRRVQFAPEESISTQQADICTRSRKPPPPPPPPPPASTVPPTVRTQQRPLLSQQQQQKPDPGHDADDDADASDVEDFAIMEEEDQYDDDDDDDDDDGSDDFILNRDNDQVDDETTIAQEEALPKEMSSTEEIALLKAEGELSIEELRNRYAAISQQQPSIEGSNNNDDDNDNNNDDDNDNKDEVMEDDVEEELVMAEKEEDKSRSSNLAQLLFKNENDDQVEEEYQPEAGDAVDDETTIEAEEKLGREMSYEDEIAMLKRENEMSVEELRAMYAGMDQASEAAPHSYTSPDQSSGFAAELEKAVGNEENDDDDDEFVPQGDEKDDETTMEAEERLGREMSVEDELSLLKSEGELPIEQLRSMYCLGEESRTADTTSPLQKRKREDDAAELRQRKQPRPDEPARDAGKEALDALEASAEKAQQTRASRPFILSPWVKLREYQQTGLNWLVSMQTRRLNGILADEMGLGKTLQTIALLAYLAAYKGIWGPHLIVVPTSVILNWETELKRFCPALKVLTYYGSAKHRRELRTGWTKMNCYHVVITSYQLAVQDAFAFKRKRWYYLVLDEAQNIKNFQSQRWQTLINFNSQRRLLLTGTPLQNSLMELWSLLHFLMPHIFRSRKEFSYWFANPMNSIIEGNTAHNDSVVGRLHGIIRPFVLRRLKKDVETQMPGKFEHVIKCQLSRRQMFIYEEFMARSSTRQALKKGGNFMGMMNVLMQLRKVCNHPDLFEPRSVVTPFALDPIVVSMPALVVDAGASPSALVCVSATLMHPLWSGSQGQPSIDAALKHDEIESSELLELEKRLCHEEHPKGWSYQHTVIPALRKFLDELAEKDVREEHDRKQFLSDLSSKRCRSHQFAFPSRILDAVSLSRSTHADKLSEALSTPAQLLAMRRNQQQRADDVDGLLKRFVFCVPKAGAHRPTLLTGSRSSVLSAESQYNDFLEPLEESLRPFQKANARLTSFFPDKKLIQFDSGKLQALAELLRELKRGGHRVLIFTQMSKMLDILEAFLNLNGHTYLRLDGSTGVDQRQRLMDRFNNDPRVFCFILSTRSGGMGINLTGADTVCFYDSDWNPSMDAQAQDRAHRIGQTREVHIFRLITEHTIEENILAKAQLKRNLDILVMDRGKFDTSLLFSHEQNAKAVDHTSESRDVLTKGGLRDILGVDRTEDCLMEVEEQEEESPEMSTEQMEKAMTSLEDTDDVVALRGVQKEVADELKEFDETIEYKKDSDGEDDKGKVEKAPSAKGDSGDEKVGDITDNSELEQDFAAWENEVGMDASAIEASLSPMERYGLRFRQTVDPFYSIFAVMEYRRKLQAEEEGNEEVDLDEIEREKEEDELLAMENGDLLATFPQPKDLIRQRTLYLREKSRLRASKKLRKLTGQDWESRFEALSKHPFWYNIDTGEAIWDKPNVLLELESYELAREKGWSALPSRPLVEIMRFLCPSPDRIRCSYMCRHWRKAACDNSFVRHVYPVEMGAFTRDESKMEFNHFRTISDALAAALPGDTIELADGHYWENQNIVVEHPIRFVGDEHNPSNVVVEMDGGILVWKACGGFCEGLTFRRPKLSSGSSCDKELLYMMKGSKLDIIESVFDNEGSGGSVVQVRGPSTTGSWRSVSLRGGQSGILVDDGAALQLEQCSMRHNVKRGVICQYGAVVRLNKCFFKDIGGAAIEFRTQSKGTIRRCQIVTNTGSVLQKEAGCVVSCSGNSCQSIRKLKLPPGFQHVGNR